MDAYVLLLFYVFCIPENMFYKCWIISYNFSVTAVRMPQNTLMHEQEGILNGYTLVPFYYSNWRIRWWCGKCWMPGTYL